MAADRVPGDVSLSVHVCADCAADVIGGRRRRMDLRPYGIGEKRRIPGGCGPSASACRRQAERPAVACSITSGVAPGHAPNGPPALDRPWVPVRRLIPVGSPLIARTGWDPALSDLNPPLATSGQENPMGCIHLKDWLGNDQSIRFDQHDAERDANR
jgi:hypothetical protein